MLSGLPEMYYDKAFLRWCSKRGIDKKKLVEGMLEEQVENLFDIYQDSLEGDDDR